MIINVELHGPYTQQIHETDRSSISTRPGSGSISMPATLSSPAMTSITSRRSGRISRTVISRMSAPMPRGRRGNWIGNSDCAGGRRRQCRQHLQAMDYLNWDGVVSIDGHGGRTKTPPPARKYMRGDRVAGPHRLRVKVRHRRRGGSCGTSTRHSPRIGLLEDGANATDRAILHLDTGCFLRVLLQIRLSTGVEGQADDRGFATHAAGSRSRRKL